MIVDDACRIRVVRAMLGMESREFAAKLVISAVTMTSWEKGRSTPQREKRKALASICQENGICFLPSGAAVFQSDLMAVQETDNGQ